MRYRVSHTSRFLLAMLVLGLLVLLPVGLAAFYRRVHSRKFDTFIKSYQGNDVSYMRYDGKRALDLFLTVPALIAIAPLLLVIALLVRIQMGSPILFKQQRPGLHGKPFMMFKFRTMTDHRDADGHLLPDADRLTSFGLFLRSTSLDELPELFNVLKDDMSLVGPRPLLMQYLDRYTPEQARRHEVRPGITGWAQVNGRNNITWEEKFALDVWYVDHCSLWFDLNIIVLTVWKVLRREGISEDGQATVMYFQGSPRKDDESCQS